MPFTAIVAGCSGIVGAEVIEHLCKKPETWSTIHAISRSRKQTFPSQVKHHSIDLIDTSPDDMANIFIKEKIVVDYVFFAAYKLEPDDEKLCATNGKMLDSFLLALSKSQRQHPIKRIVLTTGTKHYGLQLGSVRLPCVETDPRLDSQWFYYTQEDILAKHCKAFGWTWNVCRPSAIQGAVTGVFMNIAVSVALYASVAKELGDPLWFPGTERYYRGWDDQSYAPLIAEFEEWVALHPDTANEPFNIVNDEKLTWSRLWPFFSDYFGVSIPRDQFSGPGPLPEKTVCPGPALSASVKEDLGITGPVPDSVFQSRLSLTQWSQLPRVKQAWNSVVAKHGLDPEAFGHGTWDFADMVFSRPWDSVVSMEKAKKYGWTGYKESTAAYTEILTKLAKEHVIPPK